MTGHKLSPACFRCDHWVSVCVACEMASDCEDDGVPYLYCEMTSAGEDDEVVDDDDGVPCLYCEMTSAGEDDEVVDAGDSCLYHHIQPT